MKLSRSTRAGSLTGFSLVELMVSMTILTAIMLMFVGILDQTQKTWDFAAGQISEFREARVAFDLITKSIGQATLNTYYEQVDKNKDGVPEAYIPKSELHFINLKAEDLRIPAFDQIGPGQAVFFQAPLGVTDWNGGAEDPVYTRFDGSKDRIDLSSLSNLLVSRGYFVAFNGDKNYRPEFLSSSLHISERKRYRLMEFIPPSEADTIYFDYAEEDPTDPTIVHFQKWYRNPQDLLNYSRPLAENIIALCISPREPLGDRLSAVSDINPTAVDRVMTEKIAPNFAFNSEEDRDKDGYFDHLLPPLVKITMIAIDETSAIRLDAKFEGRPYMRNVRGGLVPRATWLSSAEYLAVDLAAFTKLVEDQIKDQSGVRVRYKIFSSTINLKSSKWQTPKK
jgi:uncharacterized protein (TIGR02599 family)